MSGAVTKRVSYTIDILANPFQAGETLYGYAKRILGSDVVIKAVSGYVQFTDVSTYGGGPEHMPCKEYLDVDVEAPA